MWIVQPQGAIVREVQTSLRRKLHNIEVKEKPLSTVYLYDSK
jgi:hypothetical protein